MGEPKYAGTLFGWFSGEPKRGKGGVTGFPRYKLISLLAVSLETMATLGASKRNGSETLKILRHLEVWGAPPILPFFRGNPETHRILHFPRRAKL